MRKEPGKLARSTDGSPTQVGPSKPRGSDDTAVSKVRRRPFLVQAPINCELVINPKTARRLALPYRRLLARAYEVIE
jgi:hypothetical protein